MSSKKAKKTLWLFRQNVLVFPSSETSDFQIVFLGTLMMGEVVVVVGNISMLDLIWGSTACSVSSSLGFLSAY